MIKRRGESQIENLIRDHKSLERRGQMRSNLNMLYSIGNIFPRVIRDFICTLKTNLIEKYMNVQSLETTRVPVLGLSFGSPEEK
jgi:hypothetical protein